MKKQLWLSGVLCLIGLAGQFNTPVFADVVGENLNPQVSIEDFVRSLHPHGVSMASAFQYKSKRPATQRDNVRKLLELLNKEDEKPHWPTIVVTLSIIADPSVVPNVIGFIEKLESKPRLDHFDYRALSSAVWALGILINLGVDKGSAHDAELEQASKFLITKSQGTKEKKSDQLQGFPKPAQQLEHGLINEGLFQRSAILGLAFASTEETKEEIEKIYKDESDPRFRKFLEQVIQAGRKIQRVGLFCYREPQTPRCQTKVMGHTVPNKASGANVAK